MTKVNESLLTFITEAKKRGFDNHEIRRSLSAEGWSEEDIERAFISFVSKTTHKNQVSIYLDDAVLSAVEKRAKRNLLSTSEQIEDIVRRSVVNATLHPSKPEKLDDLLVTIFSRKTRARK